LRALERARRQCIASRRAHDAGQIEQLLRCVALLRDRAGADYAVSPANARALRARCGLDVLSATEGFSALCLALARELGRGASVGQDRFEEAKRAALELEGGVVSS